MSDESDHGRPSHARDRILPSSFSLHPSFHYFTTKFTSFLGTYSCFTSVLPPTHVRTSVADLAVERIVPSSASAGQVIFPRSLPLTCTGSSSVDSTSFAG